MGGRKQRRGLRGGKKHKRKKSHSPPTHMQTRSSPVGVGRKLPLKLSRTHEDNSVQEEILWHMAAAEAGLGTPGGGCAIIFQAPIKSLQPPELNPYLELGECAGSVPATPGKGLDLGVKDCSYTSTQDPQTQEQQESSPEGVPVGRMSGVTSQESSPAHESIAKLGKRGAALKGRGNAGGYPACSGAQLTGWTPLSISYSQWGGVQDANDGLQHWNWNGHWNGRQQPLTRLWARATDDSLHASPRVLTL